MDGQKEEHAAKLEVAKKEIEQLRKEIEDKRIQAVLHTSRAKALRDFVDVVEELSMVASVRTRAKAVLAADDMLLKGGCDTRQTD